MTPASFEQMQALLAQKNGVPPGQDGAPFAHSAFSHFVRNTTPSVLGPQCVEMVQFVCVM